MSDKQPSDAKSSPAKLRMVSNERGAVLALVALLLVVFLGLAALAIDLGLLYVARGEAQRAADSAAHAGAGHFMISGGDEAGARDAAVAFARRNSIRGQQVEIDRDADIDVIPDSAKVRVRVHRTEEFGGPVSTLFARVLGFGTVGISTSAAAQAWAATAAECVLPIALPDRWCVEGDEDEGYCTRRAGEPPVGEDDGWDPDEHFYIPWIEDPSSDPWVTNDDFYTGYSNEDIGTPITLRPPSPGGGAGGPDERWNPSWWHAFRIGTTESGTGPSGGTRRFEERVVGCRDEDNVLTPGDEVQAEPGSFGTPTARAFQELIDSDEDAIWNPDAGENGCVTDYNNNVCRESYRKRPMVLFDPTTGPNNGADWFPLSNIVAVFVDSVTGNGPNVQVHATFVEHRGVNAASDGAASGSVFRILRIVE